MMMVAKTQMYDGVGDPILKRAVKTFTPICEGVAIQVIPQTQTEGGLVIPENAQKGSNYISPTGWVVAVGPEVKQIKVGDKVLLGNAPMLGVHHAGQQLV